MKKSHQLPNVSFIASLICCLCIYNGAKTLDSSAQKALQEKLTSLDESKIAIATLKTTIETTTKDLKAQRDTLKKKISDTNQEAKKTILALQTDIAKKINGVTDARKNFEKSLQSSPDKEQAKPLLQQVDKTISDHQKAASALSSLETAKEISD